MVKWLAVTAVGLSVGFVPAAAQDGSRHAGELQAVGGVRLDFSPEGAWRRQARRVALQRRSLVRQGRFDLLNAARAAPGAAAVTGIKRVPAVLFSFADRGTATGFADQEYQDLLFGAAAPAGQPYSVRSYFAEVSNGSLDLQGQVIGWLRLAGNESQYTGPAGGCPLTATGGNPYGTDNCNGLFSSAAQSAMRAGLAEVLQAADDAGVDWSQFDNDGPDAVPNSGDDDGIVDVMIFVQSEKDGACLAADNNHIWSHRWVLASPFITRTPANGGGNIVVYDYTVQSGLGGATGCSESQPMPVGTTAHESGHAFGLPDLYDTSLEGEGIGHWGLMGSGNWATQRSPAHMEAWSRNELGWITVVPIMVGGTYTLGPTEIGDTTFLLVPAGSNVRSESFLLENRQAVLSDSALIRVHCAASGLPFPAGCGGGLAIWHVDGLKAGLGFNVNVGLPQGVLLIQADGLRQLQTAANRGDAGDLYPGITPNTEFGPASVPAAIDNQSGAYVGFFIDSIQQLVPGGAVSFRVSFGNTPLVAVPTSPPDARMGAAFSYRSLASGGAGTYAWSLVAGALPPGLTLALSGLVSGVPTAVGVFNATLRVTSGDETSDMPLIINVTAPQLGTAAVLGDLLDTGAPLDPDERRYLDLLGNRNGLLDVGDFLAFVRTTGGTVSAAAMAELLRKAGHQ